jgi:hypothetical protein
VSTKTGSGNLSFPRGFQFRAARKKRMINNEMPSNNISTQIDICSIKPMYTTIDAKKIM